MDWQAAITRKYDILQQNADANLIRAQSSANLENTQAGIAAAKAPFDRQGLATSNALDQKKLGTYNQTLNSQLGLQAAQTGNLLSETAQRKQGMDILGMISPEMLVKAYGLGAPAAGAVPSLGSTSYFQDLAGGRPGGFGAPLGSFRFGAGFP